MPNIELNGSGRSSTMMTYTTSDGAVRQHLFADIRPDSVSEELRQALMGGDFADFDDWLVNPRLILSYRLEEV